MKNWWIENWPIVAFVVILAGLLILAVISPKMEAESYTRLTGKQVSYWDAVWLDLRIQEQVK